MTPERLAAAGLRVRKLVWEETPDGFWSDISFGWYEIIFTDRGDLLTCAGVEIGFFPNDEFSAAAKAAAQADFEARILAALEEVSDE